MTLNTTNTTAIVTDEEGDQHEQFHQDALEIIGDMVRPTDTLENVWEGLDEAACELSATADDAYNVPARDIYKAIAETLSYYADRYTIIGKARTSNNFWETMHYSYIDADGDLIPVSWAVCGGDQIPERAEIIAAAKYHHAIMLKNNLSDVIMGGIDADLVYGEVYGIISRMSALLDEDDTNAMFKIAAETITDWIEAEFTIHEEDED